MNKTLFEIEKEYIGDIIKFFCREYITFIKPDTADDREELKSLLIKQIENRLLNTRLINNYRVEVILYPKDERRDVVIDGLIENKTVDVVNRINISIQYRDRTMAFFETLI